MDFFIDGEFQTIYLFLGLILLIIAGILVLIIIDRTEKVRTLRSSLDQLTQSFDELDEQAKLIVKTDLELNQAQEELDKRLSGLDALQKTSRLISTTLDEDEIFERLNQPLLSELGFEKHLILIFDKDAKLKTRVEAGFSQEEVAAIVPQLEKDTKIINALQEKQIISSNRDHKEIDTDIAQLLNVTHYVMTPILAQKNMLGLVFTGNKSDAFAITEGDEELISILADQVGQAIENARLFEQVYRSSQELERKVQDRTKQLSTALEEVQRISNTKSEFISAVSHELRTPLTSIKGYASILITGKVGQIPDKVKERLEKINKHSDNLVKLINELLDIARIEAGREEMNFEKGSLAALVENAQDILTPQMKEKNIKFVTEIDESTPEIDMDASQVERVFINLISNAIKFTPTEGTITVKIKHNTKEAVCTVSDTGIGIDQENLKKLFNEFYRVENEINQNVKGTGLGLALVKKIIEAHNGSINVTSKTHEGTNFTFTFPFLQNKDKA